MWLVGTFNVEYDNKDIRGKFEKYKWQHIVPIRKFNENRR